MKHYTVSLCDCEDIPNPERINAEMRFIREIERALGGPEAVASVYGAWIEASECSPDELAPHTASTAVRWPKAADAAYRAGFRTLGDVGEAHFEIRLNRAAMGQDAAAP